MPLGILEDRKLDHVPGTVDLETNSTRLRLTNLAGTAIVLDEEGGSSGEEFVPDPNLKYDSTGRIILVPQPSDDPNDPLVGFNCLRCTKTKSCKLTITSRTGHYGDAT
jgi:hypothetical protein